MEGNHYTNTSQILASIPSHTNIFRFNISKTRDRLLKDFPEIKDLVIYRGIPNALKIVVLEREGHFIWQTGENRYLVSAEGEVAKKMSPDEVDISKFVIVDKKNLPLKVGDVLVSPSFVSFVNNVYEQFYASTNIKPTYFEIDETTFDLVLHTEAEFYVKFNTLRSGTAQLENLKAVLANNRLDIHEYVDLRINGWAYYK